MNPLRALTARKQLYVKGLADGKTKTQAALDAGYSMGTARCSTQLDTPDVKAAFSHLLRKRIPAHKITQRLAEGIDAVETKFFQKDGIVTDSRDVINWSERRAYAQLAAEYGQYATPDGKDITVNNAIGIKVTVEHIGTADPAPAKTELTQ